MSNERRGLRELVGPRGIAPWGALLLSFATGAPGIAQPVRIGDAEPVKIETPHPYGPGPAGGAAWRHVFHWPDASYIALHFSSFELAPGDTVAISDAGGRRRIVYAGRGKGDLGRFWSGPIPGDTAVVELLTVGKGSGPGFVIDQLAHSFPQGPSPGPKAICGDDDSRSAQCYETTEPAAYDASRPVARLFLYGVFTSCTGWLVGSEGHLMTNSHCIADETELANSDFEFLAERDCMTPCNSDGACPGVLFDGTATIVATSSKCNLDYTLVKLSPDPSTTYGYLTMRPGGATLGERIYITHHPDGWGKWISLASTDPADTGGFCTVNTMTAGRCNPEAPSCASLGGPPEVGYQCDTQAVSSGAPVIQHSLNQVVALHHCANCPNRGERIESIIADLGSQLPISAVARGDKFGRATATCDFNGDGFQDLAIGVPDEDVGSIEDAGAVNVLYGSSTGIQQTSPNDQFIHQDSIIGGGAVEEIAEAGDHFGAALAAGNFNRDGFCDLAVGVPGEAVGSIEDAGFVNVLYGSPGGLRTTGASTRPPDQGFAQGAAGVEDIAEAGDHFGSALVAGDFNGDGVADLAIGVPGEAIGSVEDAGLVNVLYGGPGPRGLQTTSPPDRVFSQDSPSVNDGAERGDHFGSALAAGDFNNDGRADLAVGIPDEDVGTIVDAGMVSVLYGCGPTGLCASGDQTWHQGSPGILDNPERGDHFGRALAAGDFDHDGLDDLAIGVPEQDIGPAKDTGAVAVLYGCGAAGLCATGNQGWFQNSLGVADVSEEGDGFGSALTVGDFDNDGFVDLAIGVPEEDIGPTTDAGFVNVLYGCGAAGLCATGNQGWHQNRAGIAGAAARGDHFGGALAAGDFDNDGRADLAIGVPDEDIGTIVDAGAVNVIRGCGASGLCSTGNKLWSQDGDGTTDSVADDPE